jgi:hypothetical protein
MSTQHEGMLPVESMDVSQRDDVHKLHGGAVGILGVLFLTVTGAAPISAMLFNTPISVGYGNGIGTPAGFAFATVILTIFSAQLRLAHARLMRAARNAPDLDRGCFQRANGELMSGRQRLALLAKHWAEHVHELNDAVKK